VADPIGVLVVQRGVATQAQVDQAWRESKVKGERLCSRLLETGIPEARLAGVLAEHHGVPGVDLSRCIVDLSLLDLVPRLVAEHDNILPLSDEGGRLHLAMSSPHDERVLSEVRFVTGREVSPYVCVLIAAKAAIRQAYDAREQGELVWRGASAGPGLPPLLAVIMPGEAAGHGGDLEAVHLDVEAGELIPIDAEVPAEGWGDEPLQGGGEGQ
jgi:hypothetical protein